MTIKKIKAKLYRPVKNSGYYDCCLLDLVSAAIQNNDYPVLKYLIQLRKYAMRDKKLKQLSMENTEQYIVLHNLHLIANLMNNNDLSDWLSCQIGASKNIIVKEEISNYINDFYYTAFDEKHECNSIYILKQMDIKFIYYKITFKYQLLDYQFLEFSIYNSLEDKNIPPYIAEVNNCLFLHQTFDFPPVLIDLITNYLLSNYYDELKSDIINQQTHIDYKAYQLFNLNKSR